MNQEAVRAQKQAQEKFNKELVEYQTQTIFPNTEIPEWFEEMKRIVMESNSPASLDIDNTAFFGIYRKHSDYNLYEIAALLPQMARLTMEASKMTLEEYAVYQSVINSIATEWQKMIQDKALALKRKHEALARISAPVGKKIALS